VWGEEQSLREGSDEKAEAGRTFTVPLLVLFRPNPTTSSLLLAAPPKPFAYSPRSGGRNLGKIGYHEKKGGSQRCVGEGWEEISLGHKAPAKRSRQPGAFRAMGGRGSALGAGLLGRPAPGHVLGLRTQRGRIQVKPARPFASGTGVYLISAGRVRRTGGTGGTRMQANIFADVVSGGGNASCLFCRSY